MVGGATGRRAARAAAPRAYRTPQVLERRAGLVEPLEQHRELALVDAEGLLRRRRRLLEPEGGQLPIVPQPLQEAPELIGGGARVAGGRQPLL